MTEDAIDGYTPDTTDAQGNNGSWTNSHTTDTTSLTLTKTWADGNNQDGIRPDLAAYKAALHLYADGVEVTSQYADIQRIRPT